MLVRTRQGGRAGRPVHWSGDVTTATRHRTVDRPRIRQRSVVRQDEDPLVHSVVLAPRELQVGKQPELVLVLDVNLHLALGDQRVDRDQAVLVEIAIEDALLAFEYVQLDDEIEGIDVDGAFDLHRGASVREMNIRAAQLDGRGVDMYLDRAIWEIEGDLFHRFGKAGIVGVGRSIIRGGILVVDVGSRFSEGWIRRLS